MAKDTTQIANTADTANNHQNLPDANYWGHTETHIAYTEHCSKNIFNNPIYALLYGSVQMKAMWGT